MENKTYYNIFKGMEIPKWHQCPNGNKVTLEVLLLDSLSLKKDLQKNPKNCRAEHVLLCLDVQNVLVNNLLAQDD